MTVSKLKRVISFPALFLFGLGTMVGGGFFALAGKVAGSAGLATPLSFLISGILALLNVFTFAELSSRYPVSAGEAKYVQEGFKKAWLSGLVGWMVALTGVVSAATLSVASIGFLQDIVAVPETTGIIILVVLMGLICIWGVGESVIAVVVITIIEVVALLYVLISKGYNLHHVPEIISNVNLHFPEGIPLVGILSGAFLGFYAFVGFEDMVNMAEEIKDVRKTLPKAMIWAVVTTTAIYISVVSVMVLTVSPKELSTSNTPIAQVIAGDGPYIGFVFVLVSILTGLNGALVQIVMASRVLYGLGKQKMALSYFSIINSKTQTPVIATILVMAVVLMLALVFPLVSLAEATSFILLVVFSILNAALIKIKKSEQSAPLNSMNYPIWVPMLSLLACIGILIFKVLS